MTPGTSGDEVREYVYGSYVDEVVAYTQTVGGVTKRYYPLYNHLYSVAALTDGTTGAVVERFTYDPEGDRLAQLRQTQDRLTATRKTLTDVYKLPSTPHRVLQKLSDKILTLEMTLAGTEGAPAIAGGYADGMSLYGAYLVPNHTDPKGRKIVCWGASGFIAYILGGSGSIGYCSDDCCPHNEGIVICLGVGGGGGASGSLGGYWAEGCLSGWSAQLNAQGAIGPVGGGGTLSPGGGLGGSGSGGVGAGGAVTLESCWLL